MQTIVLTTNNDYWKVAQKSGEYKRSALNSQLDEVGFIHCTNPDQTMAMINRNFSDRDDLLLLLVDIDKVKPEVKQEPAPSGRPGLFPHIYGPLNIDAVYDTIQLTKSESGQFIEPQNLKSLYVA